MQNRIVLTLTFIFTAFCLYGQSQSAQSKKNLPIRFYMPKGYWERIDFYDTLSGTLLRSFDVIKNNPYNNFPYKVIKQGPRGVSYYEIPDSARKNLSYWISPERAKDASADHAPHNADLTPYHVTSEFTSTGFQTGYKLLGIIYRMFTYDGKDSLIATHSTYYILDDTGNIVSTLSHFPEKKWPICEVISYKGEYMCVVRSNPVGFVALRESEIEIYDIRSMKSLYKTSIFESDEPVSILPVGENDFLCTSYMHEKGEMLRVFDIKNKILYQKIYSRQQYDNDIKKLDRYGITLKSSGVTEKYTAFPNKKIEDK